MESRNSAYPAARADADATASRASPAATLGIVSPRRIIGVHGEHERRRTADQGFDQRELLVGVVDERRTAYALALLAFRQNVERLVVMGRDDRFLARGIVVGRDFGDPVAGAEIGLLRIGLGVYARAANPDGGGRGDDAGRSSPAEHRQDLARHQAQRAR